MHRRVAINIVLVLVLAVRSMLPAGFMLQVSAASPDRLEVVICTNSGIKLMTVDQGGLPGPPAKSQHLDHGLCPYAAAGGASIPPAEYLNLAVHVQYAAVSYVLAVSRVADTVKLGAVSARGPPAASSSAA